MTDLALILAIVAQSFGFGYLAGHHRHRQAYRIYRETARELRRTIADIQHTGRFDNWRN